MPSTNFERVARQRETLIGVFPTPAAYENCFITGHSLKPDDTFVRSETITTSRAIKEHLAVGTAVSGNGDFEFAFGYPDWFIELANNDAFAALEEAYNATADSNITDINATTQTLLAAGNWAGGMLVETSGLTASGNNVRFRAEATSGAGSLVAPAGTFASDDAAPQAGARVLCIGVEGAAGDISVTATGLASAANIFANVPLLPGMGIKIGGTDALTQFDAGADNAFVPIKSVPAGGGSLELDELPVGWTVEGGGTKTIQIFIGDDSRTGSTVLTDTLQAYNSKTSPLFGQSFRGCASQSLNLTLALNSVVKGQGSIIGFAGSLLTALLDPNPVDPIIGTGNIMKVGSNIARLTEGGAALAAAIKCQEMRWSLANNLTPVGDLESDSAIDWNLGDAEIIIEGTYRAGDKSIIEKFYNRTDSKQFFVIYRGDHAYMVRILSGTYTAMDAPVQGRNGEWTTQMRLEAKEDPITKLLFVVTRFRKWK
jgi:tail tube protein